MYQSHYILPYTVMLFNTIAHSIPKVRISLLAGSRYISILLFFMSIDIRCRNEKITVKKYKYTGLQQYGFRLC